MKINMPALYSEINKFSKMIDKKLDIATELGETNVKDGLSTLIKERGRVATGDWLSNSQKRVNTTRKKYLKQISIDNQRNGKDDYKNYGTPIVTKSFPYTKIIEWLVRKGLAKDEKEAKRISFAIKKSVAKGNQYNGQIYGFSPSAVSFSGGSLKVFDKDIYEAVMQDLVNDDQLYLALSRW